MAILFLCNTNRSISFILFCILDQWWRITCNQNHCIVNVQVLLSMPLFYIAWMHPRWAKVGLHTLHFITLDFIMLFSENHKDESVYLTVFIIGNVSVELSHWKYLSYYICHWNVYQLTFYLPSFQFNRISLVVGRWLLAQLRYKLEYDDILDLVQPYISYLIALSEGFWWWKFCWH